MKVSLKLTLLFVFCFPFQTAFAEDQWFCKEGASRQLGEVLESCGIAKSKDEAEARKKALDGAFEEFDRICRESANCRDYEKTVEPMRTECIKGKDEQFTCYRALDFTVTHQKKEKNFDDKEKQAAIVSAISANTDANPNSNNNGVNPAVNETSTPAPPSDSPTVYRNVHYRTYDPYIYVIGYQPQVVYMRSQLPPQYVTTPAPLPTAHKNTPHPHPQHHPRHPGHSNHPHPYHSPKKIREKKKSI